MYTFVMMAALSGAPEATQFNGFFRDLAGGSGCHADSRSESDSKNCQGNSCRGCGGGLFHGRILSFFSFGGGRGSSCCGGTSSSGSGSCTGRSASSGCNGSRRALDPVRSSSCNGSGYSASCFGSSSCIGSTFDTMTIPSYPGGPPMNLPRGGYDTVPFAPPMPVPSSQLETYRPAVIDENSRGIIIVRLPEDAKLYAEGRPLTLKSDARRFVTPPLATDRDAVYNLRVEYTREGEVISRTNRVSIRAGDTKTVEFGEQSARIPTVHPPELFADKPPLGLPALPSIPPTTLPKGTPTGSAPQPLPPLGAGTVTVIPPPQPLADRAKITVKLPPGATLFVDRRRNDRSEAVREFTTPALKKGDLYTYTLRAEWKRDGQLESEERKVEFMAGEMHTVDFTLPTLRASR